MRFSCSRNIIYPIYSKGLSSLIMRQISLFLLESPLIHLLADVYPCCASLVLLCKCISCYLRCCPLQLQGCHAMSPWCRFSAHLMIAIRPSIFRKLLSPPTDSLYGLWSFSTIVVDSNCKLDIRSASSACFVSRWLWFCLSRLSSASCDIYLTSILQPISAVWSWFLPSAVTTCKT